MEPRRHPVYDLIRRIHYPAAGALVGLLFLLIFIDSIPEPVLTVRLLSAGVTVLIFLTAVITVGVSPFRFRLALVLAALALAGLAIDDPTVHGRGLAAITVPLFLWAVVGMLIHDVFRPAHPITHRLLAALNLYILAAIAFAYVYSIIDSLAPASFRLPDGRSPEQSDLVYFSFVTQTTLGYGDITPRAPPARAIVVVQSTLGVLYLAVVVAAIVGERARPAQPRPG